MPALELPQTPQNRSCLASAIVEHSVHMRDCLNLLHKFHLQLILYCPSWPVRPRLRMSLAWRRSVWLPWGTVRRRPVWRCQVYHSAGRIHTDRSVQHSCGLQTTQPTSGGAVTADLSCCANCVEPPRPQQWGPDLPFFGHCGHADPLDGWRCCSQKRVMSRPIQVRQL